MLTKDEMLEHPDYLLSTYQLEIYNQLDEYMEKNHLINKDIAKQLNVSESYVSQILNGNFNFTLKKLIQLGLMMNKVPYLEFIEPDEYWKRESEIALENKRKHDSANASEEEMIFEKSYKNVSNEKLAVMHNSEHDGGRQFNSKNVKFGLYA